MSQIIHMPYVFRQIILAATTYKSATAMMCAIGNPKLYKFIKQDKFILEELKRKFMKTYVYKVRSNQITAHETDGKLTLRIVKSMSKVTKEYFSNGLRHRTNGAAIITKTVGPNKKVLAREYWVNGNLHRVNGPAIVDYTNAGQLSELQYYRHGVAHNDNGPSYLNYDEHGVLRYVYYHCNGLRHRVDGPALMEFDESGHVIDASYWINGEMVTK